MVAPIDRAEDCPYRIVLNPTDDFARLLVIEVGVGKPEPTACLLFMAWNPRAQREMRRLQPFPENWSTLADDELAALYESAVRQPPTALAAPRGREPVHDNKRKREQGGHRPSAEDAEFMRERIVGLESFCKTLSAENQTLKDELWSANLELSRLNEELQGRYLRDAIMSADRKGPRHARSRIQHFKSAV